MIDSGETVRFSEEDLHLFSAASGDRNPLHLSREYASRSAYGERVVFGALGAIACLSHSRTPAGHRLWKIAADFFRPMFLDVDYQVKTAPGESSHQISLYDGSIPVVTLALQFAPGESGGEPGASEPSFPTAEAWERPEGSITPGLSIGGAYACDPAALDGLLARWRTDRFTAAVLCWASYAIGMELPGRSALFRRLTLEFERTPREAPLLAYELTVLSRKAGLGQVTAGIELRSAGRTLGRGQSEALIRPEMMTAGEYAHKFTGTEMAGRVALILGGSRGFGAALHRVLEAQGAIAIAYSRSGSDSPYGCGDAADAAGLVRLRERILERHSRLDLLVCNAFPAIHALRFEPNALARIEGYISRATSLVAAPLCVFLESLHQAGGRLVTISSSAVESPIREWPHYIAAKSAVEALARVAALQYPRIESLIVRPPKLLTDMTNTPLGRQGATRPEEFAARLAERLRAPVRAGVCDIYPGAA